MEVNMGDGAMCHYCRKYKCVCPYPCPKRLGTGTVDKEPNDCRRCGGTGEIERAAQP